MKIDYLKIISTFVKNTQTSGVANEGISETLKTAAEAKTAQQNITPNQTTSLNQVLDVKFNSINRMEQAKLIKELLNLPNEIEELFSFLLYKKVSSETLESLLKQTDLKLNTDLIRQILEGNSKESMNKLLKLFQQAPGGTQNTDQIKDILSLLNKIAPKQGYTAHEILTNVTLLYLPWLPLSEKQDLEIKLEQHKKKKEEEKEEESEQTALVIYITTINIGKFKISIILKQDSSIRIEIENYKEQKNETDNEYLEKILKEVSEQSRKNKINAKTELFVLEQEEKNEVTNKKREVIISPAADVSPVLIITAQKISKIILEADERISLIKKREEMVNT